MNYFNTVMLKCPKDCLDMWDKGGGTNEDMTQISGLDR